MTTTAMTTTAPNALQDFNAVNPVQPYNPNLNHGSVAIEEARAIAEVRGQIIIAQQFPRSVALATADFMEACKSEAFADTAFYSVPNRGSGPSIRFAEEAARCYGNFQYGHRELSRTETVGTHVGKSEIEVYAWDVQKNNRSTRQITVLHSVDTKQGPKVLRDQTDIDNRIANVASKQMRGRILALLPKALVAEGVAMAKRTLAGGNEKPIAERVATMVQVFVKNFGVTAAHLADYLGHSLDEITADELAELRGVAEALRDGGKVADYFGGAGEAGDTTTTPQADKLAKAAARGAEKAKEPKPEPKPEPKVEQKAEPKNDAPAPPAETTAPQEQQQAEPQQQEQQQEHQAKVQAPVEEQQPQADPRPEPPTDQAAASPTQAEPKREAMF